IVVTILDSAYTVMLSAEQDFQGEGWLYIAVQDDSLASAADSLLVLVESPLALDGKQIDNPYIFDLASNYPNPFNPVTTIRYTVGGSEITIVDVSIYNVLGQKVAVLSSGRYAPGRYKTEWNAAGYSSGVYIVCFTAGNGYRKARKILLLK
ncbi:MAG TPA: T9SS type A sorting domain-containing protein, partial [Calditrichaeota bacterium]|nr:T9SS type A sorting domain-containing protein [Calditrichota bacterium]